MQERVYIVQTMFATPAAVTGDASLTHWQAYKNAIDKAVGQWRKRLRASMKAKGHDFEHLLN